MATVIRITPDGQVTVTTDGDESTSPSDCATHSDIVRLTHEMNHRFAAIEAQNEQVLALCTKILNLIREPAQAIVHYGAPEQE